jgi:diguanylate cyclase (GGDEF)-like protein
MAKEDLNFNYKKYILILLTLFIINLNTISIKASSNLYSNDTNKKILILTDEEKKYIFENPKVKAVSLSGSAPIQFIDANGNVQGISIRVLEEISHMTGLIFECELYDSYDEAIPINEYDIVFGIPHHYANYLFDDMILSKPFLKSQTILYVNSSLDSNELDDKIYAAVEGSYLPEGIKEENSIYFYTREDSLNAVESGLADYGYGNAYSVAYYTLLNDYKNIVTIPKGKENREYCIGFLKKNDILISIINKSIDSIDNNVMNNLILDVTSHVDRKISLSMIIDTYTKEILIMIFIIISIISYSITFWIKTTSKLKIQNKRYETLSEISNEHIFEYNIKNHELLLSDKSTKLFKTPEDLNNLKKNLKDILDKAISNESYAIMKISLSSGKTSIFKAIFSYVYNGKNINSIIGKLIDISDEMLEKEKLISKSKTDGLTGLYNALATKEQIERRLKNKNDTYIDALALIDIDNFKSINDNFGHLKGDHALMNIGKNLKTTFRKTDILGRIGGDEFCIYLKDIPSVNFVEDKCRQLCDSIDKTNAEIPVSISIGVAMAKNHTTYEELFKMADSALYEGKNSGKGKTIFSDYKADI